MLGALYRRCKILGYGSLLTSIALLINILQFNALLLWPFSPKQVMLFNTKVGGLLWHIMQHIFQSQNAKITTSGDPIPPNESAIVFSNHVFGSDFYLIHHLAQRAHMLSACNYFAKDSLKWIPGFGWGLWMMGLLFIKRKWTLDQGRIKYLFQSILEQKRPSWIISYLEGTRINQLKLKQSQEFAIEHGLPILSRVMMPRTRGFIATINAFRNSHIKAVYDLTIAYASPGKFQDAPSLLRIHSCSLEEYKFHVHVKRYEMDEVPVDELALKQWVMDRFVEKEYILAKQQETWGLA